MDAREMLSGHELAGGLHGRHVSVAVIGGGQAGLSASHCLSDRGIGHVVLERHQAGFEWRERRWDSFCLVTPNRQCLLPGYPYSGDDPDGFMLRDEIVQYLANYVKRFSPPLHEGVAATRLTHDGRTFAIGSSRGDFTADQVVLATGPYQEPNLPRWSERLHEDITQIHSSAYRNPESLPAGAVLVIGTGQSGCQIAEDLQLAGREVHLATGTAPRVARSYRGRDCMTWLDEIGHYSKGIDEFPDQDAVRVKVNHYVTGREGGRDIDLRAFARDGMHLYGRLASAGRDELTFAADLGQNLDGADAVSESIKDLIDSHIAANGLDCPPQERYTPVWRPSDQPGADRSRLSLSGSGVSTVIWCTGFRRDYRWIDLPIFDGRGYPVHQRGVTSQDGLYVLGMPWQHTWGSGRFRGVGADAEYVAVQIAARASKAAQSQTAQRHVAQDRYVA